METGMGDFFVIGVCAALLAFAVVLHMVRQELGPFAGLAPGGKWLLVLALGMGVVAFSIKLTVAALLIRAPQQTLTPTLQAYDKVHVALPIAAPTRLPWGQDAPAPYAWQALPAKAPEPANNPGTPAKIALGQRLYYEQKLSGDGTLSCASCHKLYEKAGADGRRTASGIDGQIGPRNVPTVWNAAFQRVLFWDGRSPSLEDQAKGPIMNPVEMGMPAEAEAVRRLRADASYRRDFAQVFGNAANDSGDNAHGDAITFDNIARAIAAFERTLVTPDAPYDRFVRGDASALNAAQVRGMALFGSLGCVQCHQGPAFSDASLLGGQSPLRYFPASSTPFEQKYDLLADGGALKTPGQRGLWRVPSLRNVALTAPYLHNGTVDDLREVVRIMASAQLGVLTGNSPEPAHAAIWQPDRQLLQIDRRVLSEGDVDDIVAFLKALSSDTLVQRQAESARPLAQQAAQFLAHGAPAS